MADVTQAAEPNLQGLSTEHANPASAMLDSLSALEIVRLMNAEDRLVPDAVASQLPVIAAAVDVITVRLRDGGRLFYVGAGTSGRLGALDAAECPPTFGTPPDLVQALIAGGPAALTRAVEGAEDDADAGRRDLLAARAGSGDVVVGLSASGRAPYVLGALAAARHLGAATVGICCTADSAFTGHCDLLIAPVVGPELLTGSTRLKSGTAQKLVLNMLSTATMVQLGKCYGNLMVDLRATNGKLRDRAARIVSSITGRNYAEAWSALEAAEFDTKVAIVMLKASLSREDAQCRLETNGGQLRAALTAAPSRATDR
ncbi:MAG TPA: N-acetylmuramic acid 6-phosphate etherase [Chloroflexota bacterium]